MIPVVLESPYAGDVDRNVAYARRALRDSLKRGEAPMASHLLYTQVLNDKKQSERNKGINAGYCWMLYCRRVVFYVDYGMSAGMKSALAIVVALGIPYEEREIGRNF